MKRLIQNHCNIQRSRRMDKKIIGLDAFKLYGKDALTKNDDELYKSTLKNFVCNNPDEARALINMLEDLKEESE